ncbi:hypothetical protein F4805DRAFT_452313 [Annulohypoxylon moriforme]|nr:hypothetical protein F4805DRAFT_452313 [Annulohypoxylon moriforme]
MADVFNFGYTGLNSQERAGFSSNVMLSVEMASLNPSFDRSFDSVLATPAGLRFEPEDSNAFSMPSGSVPVPIQSVPIEPAHFEPALSERYPPCHGCAARLARGDFWDSCTNVLEGKVLRCGRCKSHSLRCGRGEQKYSPEVMAILPRLCHLARSLRGVGFNPDTSFRSRGDDYDIFRMLGGRVFSHMPGLNDVALRRKNVPNRASSTAPVERLSTLPPSLSTAERNPTLPPAPPGVPPHAYFSPTPAAARDFTVPSISPPAPPNRRRTRRYRTSITPSAASCSQETYSLEERKVRALESIAEHLKIITDNKII